MAKDFSRSFYGSADWQKCRNYCLKRDNYLCTKCGVAPAEEVHHIIHLTPKNIYDVRISLNPDNLTSLCKNCHFKEHYQDKAEGHRKSESVLPQYVFDENGYIVAPMENNNIPPG